MGVNPHKLPSEKSAVRFVLAVQDGWEFDLTRIGNVMTLYADSPTPGVGESKNYDQDLSCGTNWLDELLDKAGVPNYLD